MIPKKREKEKRITVKYKLAPDFFNDFKCIMSECKHSCCAGWKIALSKKELNELKQLPDISNVVEGKTISDLIEYIPNGKGYNYAEFKKDENDRCPFWNDDRLCSLQLKYGESALCRTCKQYPRITKVTEHAIQYTLTPSCEAVLEQLWNIKDGIGFFMEELPKNQQDTIYVKYEMNMWRMFPKVRSLCIDVLQCRSFDISKRLIILGLIIRDLKQNFKPSYVETWEKKWNTLLNNPNLLHKNIDNISGNDKYFLMNNTRFLLINSIFRDDFRSIQKSVCSSIGCEINTGQYTFDADKWKESVDRFNQAYGDLSYLFENLLVLMAFNLTFPQMTSPEDMWSSYVELCSLYSFFRFITVTACLENPTKQQLFHVLVIASRSLMHNDTLRESVKKEFAKNNSDSLAHMAILVCS